MGVYTNALWDYAHFSLNDSSTFLATPENLLADHFDLYLPIFSPLVYIFGIYTLPLVQLVAVLFGGIGVYRYFQFTHPETKLSYYALLYFLLFFGVMAAFSFDYHSNVVAAMLVPWLLLAFKRGQTAKIILFTILILIAKENMSLWLAFIGIGLFIQHFREVRLRYYALGIAFFSIVWFVVITGTVMPALSNNGSYPHFNFSILGNNSGEALTQLVTHPIDSFRLLFVNHTNDPANDYIKAEFWIVIAVCGFFLLRKPVYLLMLIPVFLQKLYYDHSTMWGIIQHYAIEFAPIFAIGTFEVLARIRSEKRQNVVAVVAVICSLICSIHVMDHTIAYAEKARIRIYKSAHYSREFPIDRAYEVLSLIPDDVPVSAQSAFIPHLALRESAYQFPIIRNAEYILLSPVDGPYPLEPEAYQQKKDSLLKNSGWQTVVLDASFILLKKRNP